MMEENTKTKRELAEEWLKYAVENWQNNIRRLIIRPRLKGVLDPDKKNEIRESSNLYNSFKTQVIDQANGERIKITIAHAWYGQMVDMGVGKGARYGDIKDNAESRRLIGKTRGNARRPKKWFSNRRDSIGYQAFKLSLLFADVKANESMEKIKGSIDQHFVIKY